MSAAWHYGRRRLLSVTNLPSYYSVLIENRFRQAQKKDTAVCGRQVTIDFLRPRPALAAESTYESAG